MADWLEAWVDWICWVRVFERAERRASFCGFGGMGGGAMFAAGAGMAVSNGEVRRSSGGFIFGP